MDNHSAQNPPRVAATLPPELDLRDLPAPEPMQRALSAVAALQPGQSVTVLTPLLPTPLLELLRAQGLHTSVSIPPGGGARVLIQRRETCAQPTSEQRKDGQTGA